MTYLILPLLAYLIAGSLKFAINSIRIRKLAFQEIGLGRFPSTHNSIASSLLFYIGFTEGLNAPVFGIALAFAMIVAFDSMDMRKKITSLTVYLQNKYPNDPKVKKLRNPVHHKLYEVIGGYALGLFLAFLFCRYL